MNWITAIIVTTLFFSATDVARKIGATRVDPVWATAISYTIAAIVSLTALTVTRHEHGIKTISSLWPVVVAGSAVALGAIFQFKAFSMGAKLTVASPFMLSGIAILVSLAGVIMFREQVTPRWLFGVIFALVGLYLITTK